jgi:hypothetical protein
VALAVNEARGPTVAIMQPYFLPYAGYFRLFAASDLFVIYDCVQFPRRGWVHRNQLPDGAGQQRWLTLRLEMAPRDALISELRFASGAAEALQRDLRRFPALADLPERAPAVADALADLTGTPVDYIERLLSEVVAFLGLRWSVLRSSSLAVPRSLRGQERILEIARRLGASAYVNAPGGRELYDPEAFAAAGIALRFLPPYPGPFTSILGRIASEPREVLVREMDEATLR